MNNSIDNPSSNCDDEFPQYNSFYENDDHDNNDKDEVVEDHDDDDDTTEIAYFVDATIKDISNHHADSVNDSSNNSRSFDNSIHHNSSYQSNNSNNINNNNSIQNNQSTDDCLDALFEADTNEEEFFNQRKVELQKELQLEKERSKLELERLRSGVVDNGDKDNLKGDGNGVRLGKVQDYIGKMNDRGLDSVALVHGNEEDNYEDDKSNINVHNNNIENLDNNGKIKNIEEIKQNDNENSEDLSLDDEDEDGISNVITNENESDLELSNTQEEQNDSIKNDDNNIHDVVAQKLERDKMLAKLRENYQHHVAQQVTEEGEEEDEGEDTNAVILGKENNNKSDVNSVNYDHADSNSYSLLHNQLKIGFDFIKTSRMEEETRNNVMKNSPRKGGKKSLSPKKSFRKTAPDFGTSNPYQYPIIHFVDPTSRGENLSQTNDASQSSTTQFKAWNRSKTTPPFHSLNLFTKINTIFQIRHNSSLKSIRLKNLRTNAYQEVHDVKFQPQLVTDYISDASEWHKGPLCHVYIAACASLDHYRSKVRPFLRAFVSQVDGAGSGNKDVVSSAAKQAMKKELYQKDKVKDKTRTMKKEQVAAASLAAAKAKDAAGSNASSKYMIIYVPVQPSCLETAINPTEEGNKGGGLLSRFGGSRRASNDAQSLNGGSNPNDWMIDDDKSVTSVEHQLNPAIIRKLTKEQKEIFNKICNDFPNGKTCLLSSLLDKDHELAAESKIQNQEITEVLLTLGKVMVSGFTDRVQSYNNEIRKVLDDKISEDFDWRYYFLVKESLALTYDQMQLPLESLKEYEGLEMKLPLAPESWPAESERIDQYHKVSRAALSGDSVAFREIIRWSAKDLANLSYFTLTYLFTRQARLMFQLKYPITLVERFTQYIKKVYFLRCSKCEHLSIENHLLLLARIESWIIDSCWDIKATSETLLSFNVYSDDEVDIIDEEERELINSLLELFNFARLRMFKFGDLVYTKNNNVRKALSGRPQDSTATWVPLKELNINMSKKAKDREMIPGIVEIVDALVKEDNAITPWTQKAVLSSYEYENVYLEITDVSIRLNAAVGRFRCAARLSTEQAECYIIRKEFDRASQTLLPTVDLSIAESWDSLLAWRLFRLIFCQRLSGSPPEYLRSITSCFGPKSVASLPSKFINLMIDDLEDVVNNPEVVGHTWGLSPFLGADVEFQSTKGGEFVETSNSLLKKVYKNVCYVGDEVTASLQLKSELPRAIVVDEIKVTFLEYEDYVRRHQSGVQDSYNDIVLNVKNPSILTGENTYRLPWTVMTVGIYVLESVQIKWKNAHFMLDYCTPQYPALCFDVLPNDPTQSIELNPIFLVSVFSMWTIDTF